MSQYRCRRTRPGNVLSLATRAEVREAAGAGRLRSSGVAFRAHISPQNLGSRAAARGMPIRAGFDGF